MADRTHNTTNYTGEAPRRSGTTTAFILGAVVVVLGFIVWALWGDGFAPRDGDADTTNVEITVPDEAGEAADGAAATIEGAAESAGDAAEEAGAAAESATD